MLDARTEPPAELRSSRPLWGTAGVIAAAILGVKAFAMGKEMFVASVFGAGRSLDAFFLAFAVPSFAVTVVAGSIAVAVLPIYVARREHCAEQASRLLQSVSVLSFAVLCVVTMVLVVAVPRLMPSLGSGEVVTLGLILAPVVVLQGLKAVWVVALHANHRFALAAFAPALTPIAICAVLWARGADIRALAGGVAVGSCLELVLVVGAVRRSGQSVRWRWNGFDADLRRTLRLYVPSAAGALLLGAMPLMDRLMASPLDTGSVACLALGSKVVALPVGLGAQALGTAVFPTLARLAARQDGRDLRGVVRKCLVATWAVAVPVAALVVVWSEELVQVVYLRGAFDATDAVRVSDVQSALALQIPFHVAGVVLARALASVRAHRSLFLISAVAIGLNAVLNVLLMRRFGVSGIALSTSGVYAFSCLAMYVVWSRRSRMETRCG